MSKTREELIDNLIAIAQMPAFPSQRPLKDGTILDETKSVIWNREQVDKSKEEYKKAFKELRTKKNKAYREAEEEIYQYIQEELDGEYTKEKCAILYSKAYERGHSFGFQEVFNYIDEYIDFINDMTH